MNPLLRGAGAGALDLRRLLVCPSCRSDLQDEERGLACSRCAEVYPIREGIPCFGVTDRFYDAYADEHAPFAASPAGVKGCVLRFLPFWSWREWRFWRSAVPPCERLLDCGCGRGREVFLERARAVLGYDVSWSFVRDCAARYDLVAQGSLPRLPFREGSFDVVASSHLFGHISHEAKDELVAEIRRVLAPRGRTAHVIETDSEHAMVHAAKRSPELYRRQFVEQDGHVGLEPAPRVLERFLNRGFRLRRLRLVDALIPSRQTFGKYLDHPGFEPLPWARTLRRFDRVSRSHPAANLIYEVLMGSLHLTLEQWLGRPQNAQFILVEFER